MVSAIQQRELAISMCIYIYPLSLEPLSHPIPTAALWVVTEPRGLSSTLTGWVPCIIQQLPTSYLFYT